MKPFLVIIFLLMCVSQWFVPVAMISQQEDILRHGKMFRFKTAPVDPSDPFRGKYITLNFEDETFNYTGQRSWEDMQNAFVVVGEDNAGFATIKDLVTAEPENGLDFFEAQVLYSNEKSVRIRFPFDRFYLEESKASEAEQLYWETRSDTTQVAYAVVMIKDGRAVLKDVMINDRSIVEIVGELNRDELR